MLDKKTEKPNGQSSSSDDVLPDPSSEKPEPPKIENNPEEKAKEKQPFQWPKLGQLKYLPKLLNPKEKLIIQISLGIFSLCLIFSGTRFYATHYQIIPKEGDEYIEATVGAPRFINPILGVTSDVDKDLTKLIYSSLLKYNNDQDIVPDIASDYEISSNQKVYTFYLKKDILWHDNEPLTADDVIFTIKTIQNLDYKSPLFVSFKGIEVEKVDEYTIRFNLEEPFAPFLSILTIGILPKHIWEPLTPEQFGLTAYNIKPVGSGLFKFKSLTKDKSGLIKLYTLKANENYYGKKPYLKELIFKFYNSNAETVSAFKNKNADGVSYLPQNLKEELKTKNNKNIYALSLPQYTAIFFNQKNNDFLKEKTIREALTMAINKEKILSTALNQEGIIIEGPILPGTIGYNPDIKKYGYDTEKSASLLENNGFKKITPEEYQEFLQKENELENATASQALGNEALGNQKFYLKKNDKILTITLTTVDQAENLKTAEIIQKMWQNIGIKTELNIIPGNEIKNIIKPRNYEALLFGIITGSVPDPYPFWHSSQSQDPGLNLAVFSNKEADHFLEDARKTNDEQIRQDKYVQFQNILVEELPAIFLYNPTYAYAQDSKLKGFEVSHIAQPSDRFANVEKWHVKTKKILKWTK